MPDSVRTEPAVTTRREAAPGADWDDFVRAADRAKHCHLAGWHDVLQDVMGYEPVYSEARDADGTLRGVLPLMLHRSPIFGRHLVSMPLLNDGGPLGDDDAIRALLDRALAHAREHDGTLELRTREPVPSTLTALERKVTVLLPLPDDPEELWRAFKSKVRSQVRRPMKADMETRFGADQLDAFFDVYAVNMRDLGTPVLPRRLFQRLAATFPDEIEFAAVYHQGRPVASGAGFLFRGEFEITWASALREFSREAPNMLLYWSFMEELIRRGAKTFNFGRCTPGEGTHRFKLQWGGEDQPLPWLVWPDDEAGDDGPGRMTTLASAAWQKLPVAVANRMGPAVARQLPWW